VLVIISIANGNIMGNGNSLIVRIKSLTLD
jgi:hypothetical protein